MKTFSLVLLSFLLGTATFYTFSYVQSARAESKRINALTFSNTQNWDPYFLEAAQNASGTERYKLPPPPKNSSEATENDLAILHEYQNSRTEENLSEIEQELYLDAAFFGDQTFGTLTDPLRRRKTASLMQFIIDYELPIILGQKLKHNRVRPSHLDPSLTPVIEVPHHPAYPSGHATQAHLRAIIFSQLDPENKKAYEQAAERIAHNREIAGVHYPSDSAAGAILAGQIIEVLSENNTFLSLVEEAKKEW